MTLNLRWIGLSALLMLTVACDDTVVQPIFGAGCSVGSLRPGSDVVGQFDRRACVQDYEGYSGNSVNYVSYSVTLTRGKGYYFFSSLVPNSEDGVSGSTLLTLYGKNEDGQSVPLTMSNYDAGGSLGASEFLFIAPRSGTYRLVVSNYEIDNVGDYRVLMEECPVVGTIDTVGSYVFTHSGSNCVRRNIGYQGVASQVVLVGIKPQANQEHAATVSTNSFSPIFEMGGPGYDFLNYFGGGSYSYNTGNFSTAYTYTSDDVDGWITLAVGAYELDPRGSFTVDFNRSVITLMAAREQAEANRQRIAALRAAKSPPR